MEFNFHENKGGGAEASEMRPEKFMNPPLANKNSFELCDELCELTCTNTFDIDKSSLSVTNETLTPNTLIKVEPKVINSSDNKLYDKHSSFRSTRMRGTSSDRIIAKKRHDQKSVSSLSERMSDTSGSLFEKHLGKFYKLGKLEKQNRFSTNTLYDQSPTEAFYNKTGSARLSSQELFEKFCSEDFISLYGHENDNGNYHSQSQISSDYSKSLESSVQGRNLQKDIRNVEIPESYYENREKSISYSSLGAIKKTKVAQMKKYDTVVMSRSPGVLDHRHRTHFNFDIPFSLPLDIIHYEIDDALETQNEQSRSAPLLSPDKNETQFNFEVIDLSQCDGEDSPSDATETRNLTLYEEPRSDRTSLSEFFDFGLRSKPSSFKRDFAYKSKPAIDLTNLDFRAIDDESPNTSKFVSISSPDEMNQNESNFDAKSCYSDSVFVSPEKTISREETTSKQTHTPIKLQNFSESLESSSLNTPTPVYEKSPEHGNLQRYGSLADITEKTLSPLPEHCDLESLSDSIKLSEEPSENPKDSIHLTVFHESPITSRPSMHKLKPYHPEPSSSITKDEVQPDNMATEQYDKILDIPELSRKRDKSMCFKIKKLRDSSTVTVHRRTKCFPL